MKRKDNLCIVLADPPNPESNPYGTAFPNLGLLYLAAYLREHIDNIEIHYINASYSMHDHVELVKKYAPDIYGLSMSSPFAQIGYNLINEVKLKIPKLFIVCGGPHATAAPQDIFRNSFADACCLGEGEETFFQLVISLRCGDSLNNIAGISFRDSTGTITTSRNRPLIPSLDKIPFPAWDLIQLNDYSGCRKAMAKPSAAIIASRGCLFNCTFCSNPVWRNERPWLRLRSPENIAEEVLLLYNRGIREIYIRSDEMNSNLDWAIAVFNALAKLDLKDLYFQCNLRAKPVTKVLAEAMKRARCWLCHIGVESGSQRVLNGIQKGVTIADIENACRILKECGIKTYAFVMLYQAWEVFSNLQTENTMEVAGTLLYIVKMRLKGLIDFMSCGFTTPYPGSDLYEIAIKNNLIRPSRKLVQVITPQDITLQLPGTQLWKMELLRRFGLLTQAMLFLLASESYRAITIRQNIQHAAYKLRYFLGLKTPK